MPLADGVKLGSVYLPPTTRQVITISSPSCFGPNCVPFSWRPQRSSMSGCSGSTKIAKQKKKEAVSEGGRERESTAGGTLWVLTARTPAQAGRQAGSQEARHCFRYSLITDKLKRKLCVWAVRKSTRQR